MKTYDEIKDIITNRLGITDLKSYEAWTKNFLWTGEVPDIQPRAVTQEDIDLLSPDNIDNNAFWRIAEELFQTDPVSNCGGTVPASVEEANRRNLSLYHSDGFTGLVCSAHSNWDLTDTKTYPLLEIGPGYGAFRDWLKAQGGWDYYGVDVYPRIEGIDTAKVDGTLEEITLARRYAVVIASNVFQHLSVRQRHIYYSDIKRVLMPQGLFMVSMMVDNGSFHTGHRCKNGGAYCRHYGQLTRTQSKDEILRELSVPFCIIDYKLGHSEKWIAVTCENK